MPHASSLRVAWRLAIGLGLCAGAATGEEPPEATSAPSASGAPKLAGTQEVEAAKADVVATEEGDEGVKTYKFGAVEVEGRLRSPQIIYFMRRVRAQFVGGGLGHRSFMRELSDTRRHPAFK